MLVAPVICAIFRLVFIFVYSPEKIPADSCENG